MFGGIYVFLSLLVILVLIYPIPIAIIMSLIAAHRAIMLLFCLLLPFIGMLLILIWRTRPARAKRQKREMLHNAIMNDADGRFHPTKYVKNDYSEIALYIDESAKKLSFVQFDTEEKLIYDFRELKECLVLNNGAAAISAADFLTAAKPLSLSLSLRVTTFNIQHPAYEIPLITSSTDQASDEYREKMKFAQELYTAITNIINQN